MGTSSVVWCRAAGVYLMLSTVVFDQLMLQLTTLKERHPCICLEHDVTAYYWISPYSIDQTVNQKRIPYLHPSSNKI